MFTTFRRSRVVALLKERLTAVDKRRAEIEQRLPFAHEYERQELQSESSTLLGMRRATDLELRGLTEKPTFDEKERLDEAAKRRQKIIDGMVAEQQANIDRFVEKLEAEGDHRQAKIWRLARHEVREQIERAIH